MQIFFQTKKIELNDYNREYMARRVEGLRKFFSPHAHAYIDLERTRADHNGRDLYYVSLRIEDGRHRYFVEEYQDDIRKSFDHAYGNIYRVIRDDRSKSRALLKSAGRMFKRMVRRRRR